MSFGVLNTNIGNPPNWHANPARPQAQTPNNISWWLIPDFDIPIGDIKTIWEASRFDWLLAMAQRAVLGDKDELTRLNLWLSDWASNNPPFMGANWKCGQEASIRVIHLALTALILRQTQNAKGELQNLIRVHLQRIAPTMSYAIGQANNHGTSEAAALFIGGSWLESLGDQKAHKWAVVGRKRLENRAKTLIEEDGTFSQYSVNYHRVMLDTYAFAEVWRKHLNLKKFSKQCLNKLSSATNWLAQMTDPISGDAPNIGANDGAQLIVLSDSDTRDFRPSVQLASILFKGVSAFAKAGSWDIPLTWLDIKKPNSTMPALASVTQDFGGLHIIRQGNAVVYLRYPRFRFRPSQSDALHCDIWLNGENIALDAGTFSYNVSEADTAYFNGVRAHNTVEFDDQDQMPRLGRFLFGDWLKTTDVRVIRTDKDSTTASAGYHNKKGASHNRHVSLTPNYLICTDKISGFQKKAILRWRLPARDWVLSGHKLTDGKQTLSITSTTSIKDIRLTKGETSLYYLQKTTLPVFEIEIDQPATLTTEFHF